MRHPVSRAAMDQDKARPLVTSKALRPAVTVWRHKVLTEARGRGDGLKSIPNINFLILLITRGWALSFPDPTVAPMIVPKVAIAATAIAPPQDDPQPGAASGCAQSIEHRQAR